MIFSPKEGWEKEVRRTRGKAKQKEEARRQIQHQTMSAIIDLCDRNTSSEVPRESWRRLSEQSKKNRGYQALRRSPHSNTIIVSPGESRESSPAARSASSCGLRGSEKAEVGILNISSPCQCCNHFSLSREKFLFFGANEQEIEIAKQRFWSFCGTLDP